MGRNPGELRLSRSDINIGAVSLQPRDFNSRQSKTREMRCKVTFPAANAPFPVPHNLGFVPSGFTVLGTFRGNGAPPVFAAPGIVYSDHPVPADRRVIVLKCTIAGTTADILVR